jgi:ABC-type Mn2+/Zn2+ transport system ATPase subunit
LTEKGNNVLQTPQSLVRLEQAGVERSDRWLVRDIDLEVQRGEIVTLIGPNGSGKSTTARMALGIITPSEGRAVRVPGLRVGYVPQKVAVDWTLPPNRRPLPDADQSADPRRKGRGAGRNRHRPSRLC